MTPSPTASMASRKPLIVRFYDPESYPQDAKDHHGRSLNDILAWPNTNLERSHNYIQILFPLPEGSMFNWDAPVITREIMLEFRQRTELRQMLRKSFERMLQFYGFDLLRQPYDKDEVDDILQLIYNSRPEDKSERVVPNCSIKRAENWESAFRNWARRFDHNHLRITRIIRCLRVLGLEDEARAFFIGLVQVASDTAINISERTVDYWHRAVSRPLHVAPDDEEVDWLQEWEQEQEREMEKTAKEKKKQDGQGVKSDATVDGAKDGVEQDQQPDAELQKESLTNEARQSLPAPSGSKQKSTVWEG